MAQQQPVISPLPVYSEAGSSNTLLASASSIGNHSLRAVVVSVDFPTLAGLLNKATYEKQELYAQWQQVLKQRIEQEGGYLLRAQRSVVFIRFLPQPTVNDAIEGAIQLCLRLAREPVILKGEGLPFKAGLALQETSEQDPLITASERGLAPKNGLILNVSVVEQLGVRRYPVRRLDTITGVQWPDTLSQSQLEQYYLMPLQQIVASQERQMTSVNAQENAIVAKESGEEEQTSRLERFLADTATNQAEAPAQGLVAEYNDGFDDFDVSAFLESEPKISEPDNALQQRSALDKQTMHKRAFQAVPQEVIVPFSQPETLPMQAVANNGSMEEEPIPSTIVPEASLSEVALSFEKPAMSTTPEQILSAPSPPNNQAGLLSEPGGFLLRIPEAGAAYHQMLHERFDDAPVIPFKGLAAPTDSAAGYLERCLRQPVEFPGHPELPQYLQNNTESDVSTGSYQETVESLSLALQAFVAEASDTDHPARLCWLAAPDGFGKSTIIQMARMAVDPQLQQQAEGGDPVDSPFIWMNGFAWNPSAQTYPLQLWVDVFRNLFAFPVDALAPEPCREHIEQVLSHLYGEDVPAPILDTLTYLMGLTPINPLDEGFEQRQGWLASVFMDVLQRAAAIKPLVLVLDDIDKADTGSWEVLQQLIQLGLLQLPVFLLITGQLEHFPSAVFFEGLNLEESQFVRLQRQAFDKEEAYRFLDQGPMNGHVHNYPDALLNQLVEKSNGLPLVLEEMVRFLTLKGLLEFDERRQALMPKNPSTLAVTELPKSLEALLEQRALSMDESHGFMLQAASVLGPRFSLEALAAINQLELEAVQQSLQSLWEQGWVMPDVGSGAAFRHQQLWAFWYQRTPEATRLQLHQAMLQFYQAQQQQGLVAMHPSRLAWHALQGSNQEQAAHLTNLAGVWSATLGCKAGALQAFAQVDQSLDKQGLTSRDPFRHKLMETVMLLTLAEQPAYAERCLLWLLQHPSVQSHPEQTCNHLHLLAETLELRGFYSHAIEPLNSALSILVSETQPQDAFHWQVRKLEHLLRVGAIDEAAELWHGTMEPLIKTANIAESPEFQEAFLKAKRLRVDYLFKTLALDTAQLTLEEALARARAYEANNAPQIALLLSCTQIATEQGHYELAERLLTHCAELFNGLDNVETYQTVWGLRAIEANLARGQSEDAAEQLAETFSYSMQAKDYESLVRLLLNNAALALQVDDIDEAQDALEQAQTYLLRGRMDGLWQESLALQAAIQARQGKMAEAIAIMKEAIVQVRPNRPGLAYEQRLLKHLEIALAQLLLYAEQWGDAGHLLQRLWPEVRALRLHPLIAKVAYGIARLYKGLSKVEGQNTTLSLQYQNKANTFHSKTLALWQKLGNTWQAQECQSL